MGSTYELYARERARRLDTVLGEMTADLELACKKGCAYCCFGVPLWVRLVEGFHILSTLNAMPLKERKVFAKRLKEYEREYFSVAEELGYELKSPAEEEDIDTGRLGAVCGLGMNETPCPFLKEDVCGVYEARPSMCRLTLFKDDRVCRMDWENPLAFLWKREIEPFIEGIRERFRLRWARELAQLQEDFPELDVFFLERSFIFLPKHLRFDAVKKAFRLRVSGNL